MGIETRSLSRIGTPSADSIGCAVRFSHMSRIIPAVRRPRTANAPAAQRIGIHGVLGAAIRFATGKDKDRAGVTFITTVAGAAATRPFEIGGASSESTGMVSK